MLTTSIKTAPTAQDLHKIALRAQMHNTVKRRKKILDDCLEAAENGYMKCHCSEHLTPRDIEWLKGLGLTVYYSAIGSTYIKWDLDM